jgi:hypothetical protein
MCLRDFFMSNCFLWKSLSKEANSEGSTAADRHGKERS